MDPTQGVTARLSKGGRSLDLDLHGVPLARVRLDTSLLVEEHQAVVRRLVAVWNLQRADSLEALEAQARAAVAAEEASRQGPLVHYRDTGPAQASGQASLDALEAACLDDEELV